MLCVCVYARVFILACVCVYVGMCVCVCVYAGECGVVNDGGKPLSGA